MSKTDHDDFKVGDRIKMSIFNEWGIVVGYDRAKFAAGRFSGFDVLFDGDEKITIYCNPWQVTDKVCTIQYPDYDQWKDAVEQKGADKFAPVVEDGYETALKNNTNVGVWFKRRGKGFVF